MQICYLYYSHVCFTYPFELILSPDISAFWYIVHCEFWWNRGPHFNQTSCILSEKDSHFWICRQNPTYIFSRGRGSKRTRKTKLRCVLPSNANGLAHLSLSAASELLQSCVCLPLCPAAPPQPCRVSKLFPPAQLLFLCAVRNAKLWGRLTCGYAHRSMYTFCNIHKVSMWS